MTSTRLDADAALYTSSAQCIPNPSLLASGPLMQHHAQSDSSAAPVTSIQMATPHCNASLHGARISRSEDNILQIRKCSTAKRIACDAGSASRTVWCVRAIGADIDLSAPKHSLSPGGFLVRGICLFCSVLRGHCPPNAPLIVNALFPCSAIKLS